MASAGILQQSHLILDGAMGTMLQAAGLPAGADPAGWNIGSADAVEQVHRLYMEAGAQIALANTFGANGGRQKNGKYPVDLLVKAGVEIAQRAAASAPHPCFVGLDIGPLGLFLEPMGDLTFDEAVALFRVPVEAGVRAGADFIFVETMCDLSEACAAVSAAKQFGGGLPVFCTLSFSDRGRLLTGADIPAAVRALSDLGVDALGCNCGLGPKQVLSLLPQFTACTDLPLMMKPNAGLPIYRNGATCYDVTPEVFADDMAALYEAGVWALGGCCGTTPAHILAMCGAFSAR